MKECSFEKGAAAMNLVQYESVEFVVSNYGDYKLVTETICRIKIFNKNGFKQATVIIPYVGRNRTSKITDIEGNLVSEFITEGGTIEWDTTAFGKYRVASGVYMIFVSSEDGTDTTVKKVMIVR